MRTPACCAVILSTALFTAPASAQEVDSLGGRFGASVIDSTMLPSPSLAWGLSFTATVVPVAVALLSHSEAANVVAGAGVLMGPAAGYFYGGCVGRGVQGILLRTAAVGAGVGIIASWDPHSEVVDAGLVYALIGLAAFVSIDALYDIGMVSEHVRVRNEVRRSLGLEPTLRMAADGTPMMGVTIRTGK